jgi:hypothetical protein
VASLAKSAKEEAAAGAVPADVDDTPGSDWKD